MNSRRADLLFVLGLTIATALFTAGPFAWNRTLYNDTLLIFSFFSDNVDSLNRFGEPAWWLPNINAGMPGYFYGVLGQANLARPAFVAVGAIAWLLGKLGIHLPNAQPLYVLYFGLLIPGIFLLGVWQVARRIFRTRMAVRYVLVVAAFSPAILVNLGDPGSLENTGYALLCAAAFLSFVGRPTRRSFAMLCATSLLMSVGASQMMLATAVPLLAALLLASLASSRATRRAVGAIPIGAAVAAAALLAVTALPSAIAYSQQRGEIAHSELDSLVYRYGELKSGNPLQLLVASVPGVAFDWDHYRQSADGPPSELGIRSLRWGDEIGCYYLGLLATPLAAVGLIIGRRRVRVPLFVMMMITTTTFLMYGASPLFAPFLVAVPALRTLNHFGDLLYAGGGFLVILFAAGLGLETLERRRDLLRRTTLWFPLWSALLLAGYLVLAEPPAALFGFAAMLSVGFATLFAWASRVPRRTRSGALLAGIVGLTLLDVSTLAFWYLRGIHNGATKVAEERFGRGVGDSNAATTRLASFYMLREMKALADAHVPINRLPMIAAFCAAAEQDGPITVEQFTAAFEGPAAERRIALARDGDAEPVLAAFATPPARCHVQFGQAVGDYNAVRVPIQAAQPALIFIRDGYAPQWRATLNGAPVPIHRALGAFKAVAVPAGKSELRLRFAPPLLMASLLAAYAVLVLAAILAPRLAPVPFDSDAAKEEQQQ